MVVRLWSARTTNAQSRAYLQHFSSEVLPGLRKFAGYVSSSVLTRPTESAVEILVLTVWQSLSAIEAFTGPHRETAVDRGNVARGPHIARRRAAVHVTHHASRRWV